MPEDISSENLLENFVFDILDVIFMSFACPFQIIGCNLANMPGDISSENLLENFVFDILDVICMSFACPFHICFLLG